MTVFQPRRIEWEEGLVSVIAEFNGSEWEFWERDSRDSREANWHLTPLNYDRVAQVQKLLDPRSAESDGWLRFRCRREYSFDAKVEISSLARVNEGNRIPAKRIPSCSVVPEARVSREVPTSKTFTRTVAATWCLLRRLLATE
jgi:hypothetical protein